MTENGLRNKDKLIKLMIFCAAFAVSVKVLFTGFTADEEYQLVLSYRLMRGDRLFADSWDTLQTSAFYGQFLMWIFTRIFKTTEGSLLFLRFFGIVTQGVVAVFLHRTFVRHMDKKNALFLSAAFFCTYTKLVAMPEFSNLQTWAIVTMVCLLWRARDEYEASREGRANLLTVGAALAFCVAVLASACVILIPVVAVMIARLFKGRAVKKNCLFFGTCAGVGAIYVGIIFIVNGFERTMSGIKGIVAGDDTHLGSSLLTGRSKGADYLMGLGTVALWMVGSALAAFFIYLLIRAITKKKNNLWVYIWVAASLAVALYHWFVVKTGYEGLKLYIPVTILVGFVAAGRKRSEESDVNVTVPFYGMIIGVGVFVNVLFISNVDIITNLTFLNTSVLWGLAAFAMKAEKREDRSSAQSLLAAFFFVVAIGTAFTLNSGPNGSTVFNIPDLNYMRKGPAKWAFVSRSIEAAYDTNTALFADTVAQGSNVLVVSNFIHNQSLSTLYMVNDSNVSHYTVNSTPTYGDKLYDYWEEHPDKRPNVVVINADSCTKEDMEWAEKFLGNKDEWICYSLYRVYYYVRPENYIQK